MGRPPGWRPTRTPELGQGEMSIQVRILLAATVIVLFPVVLVAIVGLADRGLRAVLSFKALQQTRPWIWITPGLVFMGTVLVYPLLDTLRLSLHDAPEAEVGVRLRWPWRSRRQAVAVVGHWRITRG